MPSRFAVRLMNRLMAGRIAGRPAQRLPVEGYALRVLEVPGRSSGRAVRTPIGVLAHAGGRFVVSPDTTRDWPANLRAARACVIVSGDRRERYSVTALRGGAAAEIVATYLRAVRLPWVTKAFGFGPDTPASEIETQIDRMAVFRLEPADD